MGQVFWELFQGHLGVNEQKYICVNLCEYFGAFNLNSKADLWPCWEDFPTKLPFGSVWGWSRLRSLWICQICLCMFQVRPWHFMHLQSRWCEQPETSCKLPRPQTCKEPMGHATNNAIRSSGLDLSLTTEILIESYQEIGIPHPEMKSFFRWWFTMIPLNLGVSEVGSFSCCTNISALSSQTPVAGSLLECSLQHSLLTLESEYFYHVTSRWFPCILARQYFMTLITWLSWNMFRRVPKCVRWFWRFYGYLT